MLFENYEENGETVKYLFHLCLTQTLQFDIKKLGTLMFIFSLGILPSILKLKYSNPITLKVKRP